MELNRETPTQTLPPDPDLKKPHHGGESWDQLGEHCARVFDTCYSTKREMQSYASYEIDDESLFNRETVQKASKTDCMYIFPPRNLYRQRGDGREPKIQGQNTWHEEEVKPEPLFNKLHYSQEEHAACATRETRGNIHNNPLGRTTSTKIHDRDHARTSALTVSNSVSWIQVQDTRHSPR